MMKSLSEVTTEMSLHYTGELIWKCLKWLPQNAKKKKKKAVFGYFLSFLSMSLKNINQ